ncbi:MAG: type VI secretion system contractile sheath large subunit, partial [Gammaproteobacteria bacterium]|nr:type VI secretion system contractile sheath large subunit [Gammaproteobacteria bacterium]
MADKKKQGDAAETETKEVSFLEQAISATKPTPKDETKELLKTLTAEAMSGTVKWDKNLSVTINKAIAEIDKVMSRQLTAIMHNEKFQKLEGSWRGLN